MTLISEVPHITQNNNAIANDCGQACAAMLVNAYTGRNLTSYALAVETGTANGQFTSIAKMIQLGYFYGLNWHATTAATIERVLNELDAGKPVICLVDYRQFSDNPTNYRYAHFLVAIGYNEISVIVHDPLRNTGYHAIPRAEFKAALDTPSVWKIGSMTGLNYANQAILPEQALMSLKGLGYNIHAMYLNGRKDELIQRLKAAPPPLLLAMDEPKVVREIAQALPNTRVIYRKYIPDNSHRTMSPAQYVAAYEAENMTQNVWLYIENEPDSHIAHAPHLSAWLTEVASICVQKGYKAVLGNFSIGTPDIGVWQAFDTLLALANRHPDKLMIGLHEYFPHLATFSWDRNPAAYKTLKLTKSQAKSWYLGRFVYLIEYCQLRGWGNVNIAITEFGTDIIHDSAALDWQRSLAGFTEERNGYHTCSPQYNIWAGELGTTAGAFYFDQLQWAWSNIYKHYPQVKGVCHFSYGGEGKWTYYDVAGVPDFHSANIDRGNFSVNQQVINCTERALGLYKYDAANTTDFINIRSKPTVMNNTPIAKIYGQQTLTVTDSTPAYADGYCWYQIKMGTVTGWVAMSIGLWKFISAVDICDYSEVLITLNQVKAKLITLLDDINAEIARLS